MNFKTKKINTTPKTFLFTSKKFRVSPGVLVSFSVIAILIVGIIKIIGSIDYKFILKAAGEELKTDSYGHSNFLILGTGGKNHDGGDLTDTMIVAGIDNENKLITLISIPRDIYVKDGDIGNSKINEIYYNALNYYQNSDQALEHLRNKVESLMGIPIHYYLKVDFNGFKELVDILEGIDVYVENAIYDPYYPKDGTYLYEPFKISSGQHHLDGITALKYARSRKTTSDFDRAERQQQIIYAIKEKALQTKLILNSEKITAILDTLKENIETNITIKEILTLGSIAGDYNSEQIIHKLIHDDPTQCGGFLYTPAREFYNGMFVLLPAGGFEFIHLYSDLNFNSPKITVEKNKIHILNGTKTGGIAGETKQILKRFCFDIVRFGNAKAQNITQTTYYYQKNKNSEGKTTDSRPEALNFLQKIIPGQEVSTIPADYLEYMENADIILEIGADYTNSAKYLNDPFYNLPALKPTIPATNTSDTANTQ